MIDLQGYGWQLVEGLKMTVLVSVLAFGVSVVLGLVGATAKLSRFRAARAVADVYTVVIRGVPELILLILFYFGVTMLLQDAAAAFGREQRIDINPFFAGMLTIGFVYGAFATEVFRGAILAVPPGQIEAAKSLALPPRVMFFRVVLPQAMRFALPALGNLWVVVLKDSALISVVGIRDLLGSAATAAATTRMPFTFYAVVALIFLLLTIASVGLFQLAERAYGRGYRRS